MLYVSDKFLLHCTTFSEKQNQFRKIYKIFMLVKRRTINMKFHEKKLQTKEMALVVKWTEL